MKVGDGVRGSNLKCYKVQTQDTRSAKRILVMLFLSWPNQYLPFWNSLRHVLKQPCFRLSHKRIARFVLRETRFTLCLDIWREFARRICEVVPLFCFFTAMCVCVGERERESEEGGAVRVNFVNGVITHPHTSRNIQNNYHPSEKFAVALDLFKSNMKRFPQVWTGKPSGKRNKNGEWRHDLAEHYAPQKPLPKLNN